MPLWDRVLLVIAHPDDEAMFFGPILQRLAAHGTDLRILCLSTGNAAGLGRIRKNELLRSCETLGVSNATSRCVTIVDDAALQDGMHTIWDEKLVASYIGRHAAIIRPDMIITFDPHGVSGHTNHRALNSGLQLLLRQQREQPPWKPFQLVSTSIVRKFGGPTDALLWIFGEYLLPSVTQREERGLLAVNPLVIVRAMTCHWSQLVWFRILFMVFSRYTYINTIKPMTV